MGISEIDLMQTEQIEDLENDVKELRDKINLIVSDITDVNGVAGATRDGIVKKLNDAIDDADDINTVLNAGYSVATGGGESNTGILKRLDQLFDNLEKHRNTPVDASNSGSDEEAHPYASGNAPSWTTATCNLSGTAQGSATRSAHTTVSQSVSTASPSYSAESTAVMTLKNTGEIRARKLARVLLNKTR
jgi:activator of HSP90 ATPase